MFQRILEWWKEVRVGFFSTEYEIGHQLGIRRKNPWSHLSQFCQSLLTLIFLSSEILKTLFEIHGEQENRASSDFLYLLK